MTPLLVACLAGNMDIAKVLFEQHCRECPSQLPPTDTAGNTLLHWSMMGNQSMVKELLMMMQSLGYTNDQLQQLVKSENKVRYYMKMI